MYCDVEIKQLENDLFSVKLDGKEISQYITGFSLTERAGGFPVFSVTLATDTINLSTRAIHEIPQPYKWTVESELARENLKRKERPGIKAFLRKVRMRLGISSTRTWKGPTHHTYRQ